MSEPSSRKRIDPPTSSVSLFVTCLVDQFKPQVAEAVVQVLESEGIEVDVPREQTCCGQPAFNSGFRGEARQVAERFLDVFDDRGNRDTPIVAPSGSCAAMVRNYYPVLFRDDPRQLERTNRVAARLWEFSEFLVDGMGKTESAKTTAITGRKADETTVSATYHRCCHALRELGIDRQPETLLESASHAEILPLERSEVCCGFGGSFSVKMPDISTAMLDEKLDNVEATGASRLVAGDTGCIMHMEGGLRRRGSSVQVLHIAELLAESASQKRANPVHGGAE